VEASCNRQLYPLLCCPHWSPSSQRLSQPYDLSRQPQKYKVSNSAKKVCASVELFHRRSRDDFDEPPLMVNPESITSPESAPYRFWNGLPKMGRRLVRDSSEPATHKKWRRQKTRRSGFPGETKVSLAAITCREYRPLRSQRDGSWHDRLMSCCQQPVVSHPCLRCKHGSFRCP